MLKGRLNQYMRQAMLGAIIGHGFDKRRDELMVEGTNLRNDALLRLLTGDHIAAIKTLVPLCYRGDERRHDDSVNWGSRVAINCAGPKIDVGIDQLTTDYYAPYRPVDGAIPILKSMGELRLDLESGDELGTRAMDWADRVETYKSERRVAKEQVEAALAAFSTVRSMQDAWPDVMPLVKDIIEEHLGRPAPTLPAVVIGELNAKLGLPPANDDAQQAAAA